MINAVIGYLQLQRLMCGEVCGMRQRASGLFRSIVAPISVRKFEVILLYIKFLMGTVFILAEHFESEMFSN